MAREWQERHIRIELNIDISRQASTLVVIVAGVLAVVALAAVVLLKLL